MIGVRAYTEWESFAQRVLILSLAKDTSRLAGTTEFTLARSVTADTADALLTSRGYLEFRDVERLRSEARKWLVASPFERLTSADRGAIDDLRAIRNFVIHRSRQSDQAYRRRFSKTGTAHPPMPGEMLVSGTPSRLSTYLATLTDASRRLVV
jgi:hypothetical protein